MARKIPLLRTALATLTAATGVTAAAPAEAQTSPVDHTPRSLFADVNPADPLLWTGVLRNSAGVPSAGVVNTYVQPNPGEMDLKTVKQIPLVRVDVDASGKFELRAAYRPDFDALIDKSGSLTLMTVASTTTGEFNLGEAMVRWVNGAWVLATKAAALPANTISLMADSDKAVSFDMQTLPPATVTTPGTQSFLGDSNPGPPGVNCVYIPPEGASAMLGPAAASYHPWLPDAAAIVGVARIEEGAGWMKVTSDYNKAETTGTTIAANGGAGWFAMSGESQMGTSTGRTGHADIRGSVNVAQVRKWAITASRRLSHYGCRVGGSAPIGGNSGPLQVYEVVNQFNWEHDYAGFDAQPLPLGYDHLRCDKITPTGSIKRENGSSQSVKASFSLAMDGKVPFFGQANVGMSIEHATSGDRSVTTTWENSLTNLNKYVCGDKDFPSRGATDAIALRGAP